MRARVRRGRAGPAAHSMPLALPHPARPSALPAPAPMLSRPWCCLLQATRAHGQAPPAAARRAPCCLLPPPWQPPARAASPTQLALPPLPRPRAARPPHCNAPPLCSHAAAAQRSQLRRRAGPRRRAGQPCPAPALHPAACQAPHLPRRCLRARRACARRMQQAPAQALRCSSARQRAALSRGGPAQGPCRYNTGGLRSLRARRPCARAAAASRLKPVRRPALHCGAARAASCGAARRLG